MPWSSLSLIDNNNSSSSSYNNNNKVKCPTQTIARHLEVEVVVMKKLSFAPPPKKKTIDAGVNVINKF